MYGAVHNPLPIPASPDTDAGEDNLIARACALPLPMQMQGHQGGSSQLTLSFQGEAYVFDSVSPERVRKILFFSSMLFFFFLHVWRVWFASVRHYLMLRSSVKFSSKMIFFFFYIVIRLRPLILLNDDVDQDGILCGLALTLLVAQLGPGATGNSHALSTPVASGRDSTDLYLFMTFTCRFD